MSDRLLLRGVPTNGLAWWSLTSPPGERSRLKPRSLRISREINVPWTRVHTLGSWGWTYVFPGKSANGTIFEHPSRDEELLNFAYLPPDSPISAVLQKPVTYRNSRILSTYSWWFVSGSSIGISLVGKLPYNVGSLSIRGSLRWNVGSFSWPLTWNGEHRWIPNGYQLAAQTPSLCVYIFILYNRFTCYIYI